ncbi:hypothetical protein TNCV_255691 [Trichonephila clavipes]|nr:hypothetical protein TNCV_255691 [Trichonephila clavipes]
MLILAEDVNTAYDAQSRTSEFGAVVSVQFLDIPSDSYSTNRKFSGINVLFGFTAPFILGPLFFEEIGDRGCSVGGNSVFLGSHDSLRVVSTMTGCRRLLCRNCVEGGSLHRLFLRKDGALPLIPMGTRVGRNQATEMRIFDRWMWEGTDVVDRSHLSAPLHCLRVPFDAVYSRMVCPQDVHFLVYLDAELQMPPPPMVLRKKDVSGRMQQNVFTDDQRYISEMLEPVVLPYLQGLATAKFQQDNAQPHVTRIVQRFFINHQNEKVSWPAHSLYILPKENM